MSSRVPLHLLLRSLRFLPSPSLTSSLSQFHVQFSVEMQVRQV